MAGDVSWDVTADVQAVLDAATDEEGEILYPSWIVQKTEEHKRGRAVFLSREGAGGDPALAPRLILEFETEKTKTPKCDPKDKKCKQTEEQKKP